MNMDINFPKPATTPADIGAIGQTGIPDQAKSAGQAREARPLFTISRGASAPEDVQAASLPADTLSRDDDLGRLVSAAFNLPPPPMPVFPADN